MLERYFRTEMSPDIQGTFVSEKVNRVRWIPEEYTESNSFLTGSWDNDINYIKLWSFESNFEEESAEYPKVVNKFEFEGDVTELKFIDKLNIVTSSSNGFVKLLTLSNYEKSAPFKETITWDNLHHFDDGSPSSCAALAVMDGDVVSVGEDGRMNFLTSHQSQVVRTIDNADSCSLHCVCFLKHNEVLTGNLRGQMKIWDLRSPSNSPASTFLLSGDQVAATSMVHHPTQRHLVLAGSENGALAVWDLRVNTYPASLLNAHSAAVSEIQFHPDQPQRLFTCSASGEIWHWNTSTMSKQITTTMNATVSLNESTINPWLMSDDDRANLEVTSLMSDLHKPINSIDCNKNKVLCGCDNEAVYIIKNVFT